MMDWTPNLEFLAVSGYCLLDILENFVCFTVRRFPEKICCALITDLPQFEFIHKSTYAIHSLRIQTTLPGVVICFADSGGLGVIKFSQVVDLPKHSEKTDYFAYKAEDPVLLCIHPFSSFLLIGDGKYLKARYLMEDKTVLTTIGVNPSKTKDISIHPSTPNYAVVLLEDQSCRIWDIHACKMIHSVGLSKITTLSSSLIDNCILFGTKDSQVLSLSFCSLQCTQLCSLPEHVNEDDNDHSNYLHGNPLSLTTHERSSWSRDVTMIPSISKEFSNEIVVLTQLDLLSCSTRNCESRSLQLKSTILVVLSRARLYIINLFNHNIMVSWKWTDLQLPNWAYIHDAGITTTSQSVNFWIRGNNDSVAFFTISLENLLPGDETNNLSDDLSALSLVARDNLLANSVLNSCDRRQLFQNNSSNNTRRNKTDQSVVKLNKSLNKPVTFGHAIKSSGYAKQEPIRKMFHPMVNGRSKSIGSKHLMNEGKLTKLTKLYPDTDEVPSVLQLSGSLDSSSTPIYKVAYSPSGNSLASCLGNGICLIARCDKNTVEEKRQRLFSSAEALRGHLGPVLYASWSTNSRLLLTCSSDRTARIWRIGGVKELNKTLTAKVDSTTQLIFDSIHGGATNDYGEKINLQRKKSYYEPFQDNISFGNFYYMDSFVYLVSQNIIRLYSYSLSSDNKNILEKGFANNTYKLVGEFPIQTCNQLTSIASVNIFYSYLILCAGSDRRLSILDLNCGQIVQEIKSAHNQCITGIALNQGSLYSSFCNTNESSTNTATLGTGYTVYATVAPKDNIRIWDLRENRYPVIKLVRFPTDATITTSSAASRNPLVPPVTAVFSPCGTKLLAGGTTDANQPSPIIYDIRKPSTHPLAVLNVESRVSSPATVVDWHPLRPEISSGSHDGVLSIYGISY
uniref:WD_REPEATS_REGION domain-containing protein n=1 Tax=Trichobilharzia regenti TaxID=157069 RepID=A0AA85K5F8_TRIRE|nr:unnamed protein product [Trichobilharzia regenti]